MNLILAMTIVGGLGTLTGPVVGATLLAVSFNLRGLVDFARACGPLREDTRRRRAAPGARGSPSCAGGQRAGGAIPVDLVS